MKYLEHTAVVLSGLAAAWLGVSLVLIAGCGLSRAEPVWWNAPEECTAPFFPPPLVVFGFVLGPILHLVSILKREPMVSAAAVAVAALAGFALKLSYGWWFLVASGFMAASSGLAVIDWRRRRPVDSNES